MRTYTYWLVMAAMFASQWLAAGEVQDGAGVGLMEPDDAFTDAADSTPTPVAAGASAISAEAGALKIRADDSKDKLFKVCADEKYRFTPAVRDAYLAYARAKARADLAAMGKVIPEDFFSWIDRTPDVVGSVYGARENCANVLLMLYSIRLDLGRERFEKYRQLALVHAIVRESLGPAANITPHEPLKLVIPPCPLKPVDTTATNRILDKNDHIINFLNEHPIIDARGTNRLTAADVMASRVLQEEFNAYMKAKGCDVNIDCGDHVIYHKRKERVTGPYAKGILEAFKMFKAAYIAKGLLPEKADPSPSPAENCLYLIRNDECVTPAKSKSKLPQCPLTSPWPILTFLTRDVRSLREQDDIWQRYRDRGELRTYGEYIGPIAQQFDFQSARRLCPFPFAYKTFQMMLKDGGVCGTMANIAVRSYKSLGVPASTAGQPGHCALVYFAYDAKNGTYHCKGSQFMRAGPKDTNVLTPWCFGEKDEKKMMVYHQSIAWAMNHGFESYVDSTMAWQLVRLLPEATRQAHGQDLLESGLALNPYNFLLADTCGELAATPQAKLHFWKAFTSALDAVVKPECPKTGLYPDTVKGRIIKALGKMPVPADKAAAREVLSLLRDGQGGDSGPLNAYRDAVEGVSLARKCAATASSVEPGHGPELAVDGKASTYWGSAFQDDAWLSVDLGSVKEISRVDISWEAAYAKSFSVRVSVDGGQWSEVSRTDDGNGGTAELRITPVKARYVRVVCIKRSTKWGNAIRELDVYP